MASDNSKLCLSCHVESAGAHLPGESCESNEECIGWYSTEHHLLFCKERIKAFKLFVPKIDQNLLSRFGDLFELDEKYSMLLSSPTAAEYVNLPKIEIATEFYNHKNYSSGTMVVNDTLDFYKLNDESIKKLLNSMASKSVICVPRKIDIDSCNLSSENILCLLSSYAKELTIRHSKCTPNLKFIDIIKKSPNIEYFWSSHWDIEINKTWVEDLLKYKKGKNLRKLYLKLGVVEELNVEKFREFLRTKCTNDVFINLTYAQQLIHDNGADTMKEKLKKIVDELYQYMEPWKGGLPYMFIGFDGVGEFHYISLKNCNNRRVMPIRAATKRRYTEK